LLGDQLLKHECKQERVFDIIEKRLFNIENKVDKLLAFKWQLTGGAALVAAIVSMAISFFHGG
jgi:hypothetical protein